MSRFGSSIVLAAALLAPPAAPALGEPSSWRDLAIWDDGKAEFCAYEVTWPRYGQRFPGRALMILVKEPWAPDLEVKADTPRADGFDVLKLNHVRDVPTGIYTYHQMASAYLRRDGGALRKLAVTSSEGCGISTAQMLDGRLETRSYFDGQGERETAWPAGALAQDALAATLRDFVAGEAPRSIRVFPSLMAGRFAPLEAADWNLTRKPPAEVEVPAGRRLGVEIRLERSGERQSFVFAPEPPHPLLLWETGDGLRYALAKCERLAYWQMNGPGGESWLPEGVR